MSDDVSSLPPLSPGGPLGNNGNSSLSQIKLDLMRVYPRVQTLERQIEDVRSRVPMNLIQTMSHLSHEVERIKKHTPDLFNVTTLGSGKDELEPHFTSIEDKVLTRCERLVNPPRPTWATLSCALVDDDAQLETGDCASLSTLEAQIAQHDVKSSSRIAAVEQALSRRFKAPQGPDRVKALSQKSDGHRRKLSELTAKMNAIKNSAAVVAKAAAGTAAVTEKKEAARLEVPDFAAQIGEVQTDIAALRRTVAETVRALEERAEECDAQGKSVLRMEKELMEATADLESRVIEAEEERQTVLMRMEHFATKVCDKGSRKALLALAMQLRVAHDTLKADIATARTRVRKVEMSVPLVVIPKE